MLRINSAAGVGEAMIQRTREGWSHHWYDNRVTEEDVYYKTHSEI